MHTQVMGACSYEKNLVDYLTKSEIAQNQITEMTCHLMDDIMYRVVRAINNKSILTWSWSQFTTIRFHVGVCLSRHLDEMDFLRKDPNLFYKRKELFQTSSKLQRNELKVCVL